MSGATTGLVLLTGATGYVGGRLLRALEKRRSRLRCLVRDPERLRSRVSADTEIVKGDVFDVDSLRSAMAGVEVAYYLVHSMEAKGDFEERDRTAARNFVEAARAAGVRRIVYLGGLGGGPDLSPHLASRQEVGHVLRESGVSTIELRASIVLGSGSLSFELVRALVERLPIMVTPRWVRTRAQPIAIEDVVAYLVGALDLPHEGSAVYEIGGADVVSYLDLMGEVARQRGRRPVVIPVPVLTPWLSSLWLGLVTPLFARVGRALIEGVRNETVVRDDAALRDFPVRPLGMRDAIARALHNEDRAFAETRWSDALSSASETPPIVRTGSRIVHSRNERVGVAPSTAFVPIERIGGRVGWYWGNALWRLRGFLDLLLGGVGMRRGRRDPERLAPGETVDGWRVEAIERPRLLRLRAEMRMPGRAWLQFEVDGEGSGSIVRQTGIYDPAGILGRLYWIVLYPIHVLLFARMLKGIARAAEREGSAPVRAGR